MRSLYLRIYVTVVAVLALFAVTSGWLLQRHLDEQRVVAEGAIRERVQAWGDLLERSMPAATAPIEEQAAALRDWSQRLRLPMALDDAQGKRIAASDSFLRRDLRGAGGTEAASRTQPIRFDDGRRLWVPRMGPGRPPAGARGRPGEFRPPWMGPPSWPDGLGLAILLLVLFVAVAAGAFPVVRRLTRRLEALKQGVEAFGAGALHQRVAEDGRDEVAAVGASFNRAAGRIEALLRSHQSLLANASHELRSPLARLKMAVAMLEDAAPAQKPGLRKEIDTDIAELDALVEEVLLASRLDASATLDLSETVDLLGLAVEEASRVGAVADGDHARVPGDERLLRRAVRNLLENARRYGGREINVLVRMPAPPPSASSTQSQSQSLSLSQAPVQSPSHPQPQRQSHSDSNASSHAHSPVQSASHSTLQSSTQGTAFTEIHVCDRGPGVPEAYRERIFEAFFRLPGHAEHAGGVGLGLSLVRQIAERHGGQVRCEARDGGGSCFVLQLPAQQVR